MTVAVLSAASVSGVPVIIPVAELMLKALAQGGIDAEKPRG